MTKLSVIIPVYNEEKQIIPVMEFIMESKFSIPREFIVIDDCSTDASLKILENLQAKYSFTLIKQPFNQGKGAAIIEGIKRATGEIIVIQDADFEYDHRDVNVLIDPIINNQADVVYGSRFKKSTAQVHRTYHYFVNRFLTMMSNLLSGVYLTDMETCYKVFKADLIKSMNLSSKRFGIEVEMTAYLAKTRARIFELPISYFPRTVLQGKKINWKDGVAALWHLFRFNKMVTLEQAFHELPSDYDPQTNIHSLKKPILVNDKK